MSRLRVVLPVVALCLALGVAGCGKKAPAPALPPDILARTAQKYAEALRLLTS